MKPISIPEGLKTRTHQQWLINGYQEIQQKGQTYRHYCLSKFRESRSGALEEGLGFTAITQKKGKQWKGVAISDAEYYRRIGSPTKFVKLLETRK